MEKKTDIFRCFIDCLGAVTEGARGECGKDGGGEGMIEILSCVICEFTRRNIS